MDILAKAVRFDDSYMWIDLSDGRTIGVPYAWFPRLLSASPKQREAVEVGRFGLHWDELDEDISIAGLLAGRRDQTVRSVEPKKRTRSNFMKDHVVTPGGLAPRSGIYEQVGPRGGRTGEYAESTRGRPLPPTDRPGHGWRLVTPAHHRSGK
jgi:hypothetical protein